MGKTYYEKIGRRYKPIGEQFEGFPTNGIWLVQDGTQNCIVKLCDIPKTPKYYPALAYFQDECADYILKKTSIQESYSLVELAKWAAEFYAKKMEETDV